MENRYCATPANALSFVGNAMFSVSNSLWRQMHILYHKEVLRLSAKTVKTIFMLKNQIGSEVGVDFAASLVKPNLDKENL